MIDVNNLNDYYARWSNYYLAMLQLPDRERRAWFGLAIDEYIYEGKKPNWEPTSLEAFLWRMIVPSMDASIKGKKSKGKGTGERPSMKGNQNASKSKEMSDDQAEEYRIFLCGLGVYNETALEYIKQVRANGAGINRNTLKKQIEKAADKYGATPQQCIEAATDKGEGNRGFCLEMVKPKREKNKG